MELRALAEQVLFEADVSAKLHTPEALTDERPGTPIDTPRWPARTAGLRLDDPRPAARFPRVAELDHPDARARVLHSFANHELLAMELMALVLLRFPSAPRPFRLGLAGVLADEQEHLRLYLGRLRSLGSGLGEHRVSPFFWSCLAHCTDPMSFVVGMSLGFEQANLDHSLFWLDAHRTVGDHDTAAVLQQVYDDEVRHVRHGLHWFRRWRGPEEDDWDGFVARTAGPISPARARGPTYSVAAREACGLEPRFIRELAVWSNSRGRPPVLHTYNPGCEEEVAGRRLSGPVQDLRSDLAILPFVLAGADDVVLVPERPSAEHLASLQRAGFQLPEFATTPPADRPAAAHQPFGQAPGLPGWSEHAATWYRRSTGLAHFQERWTALDPDLVGPVDWLGEVVRSMDDVEHLLRTHGRVVAKAELSSSGRGLRWLAGVGPADRRWLEARLSDDGALVVQPWLERVCELSATFRADRPGRLARSVVDARGRYRGSVVGWALQGLPGEVHRLLHGGRAALAAFEALRAELPFHGLDGLVHRRGGRLWLHPGLELNPRMTMGHYTHALAARVKRGTPARLEIVTGVRDLAAHAEAIRSRCPLELERSQLVGGALILNDPVTARRFLGVLRVGRAVEDLLPSAHEAC